MVMRGAPDDDGCIWDASSSSVMTDEPSLPVPLAFDAPVTLPGPGDTTGWNPAQSALSARSK